MPTPSPLAISTSALARLVKEEKSYHTELAQQEARLNKTPSGDPENAEYQVRQEAKAIEETKAVIVQMKAKVNDAAQKLNSMLGDKTNSPEEEAKAKDMLKEANWHSS